MYIVQAMKTRIHPPPRTHKERSDATRAQLITAAIEVVRDKSFQGASVFEVAKAAGVTPGAFQHHFGSKAELMMQVTESIIRGGVDEPLQWPQSGAPLKRRAQQVAKALWERIYAPDRFLVAWQIYFGSAADPQLRTRMVVKRSELNALLHQQFLVTFPELAGQDGTRAFVDTVLSTLRGIGIQRLFGPQPDSVHEQLGQVALLIELRCAAAPSPKSSKRKA